MNDLYWGAIGIFLMGVLTGAALCAFLGRREARREERRRHRTSDRMKTLVEREARQPTKSPRPLSLLERPFVVAVICLAAILVGLTVLALFWR